MIVIFAFPYYEYYRREHIIVFSTKFLANFYLLLVVIFWGLTFPLQKAILVNSLSPAFYNALRFAVAVGILCSFKLFKRNFFHLTKKELLRGIILGLFLSGGYVFQTWGLVYTTASKSAFITALYVGLVAIMAPFFEKRTPTSLQIVALGVSIVALYFLTNPAGGGFNFGDFLTLLCAISYALHVLFITHFTRENEYELSLLLPQLMVVMLVNIVLIPIIPGKVILNWEIFFTAVFAAVFATIFAIAIQLKYQKHIGSFGSSLVYVGEPAFALLFAVLLLNERITMLESLGLIMMAIGIILGSWSTTKEKEPESEGDIT